MSKIKLWLLLIPAIAIALIGWFVFSKLSHHSARLGMTQPALDVTNGTLGDQTMRKAAGESVAKLSAFRHSPIAFRIMPGRGRYIVNVYWVGHEKQADGIEITYSDDKKLLVAFSKDTGMKFNDPYFYWAAAFSEDFPEGFNENTPQLVSTVTLTQAKEPCSNTVSITAGGQNSDIWTKAIGANVNDDFFLWGFEKPPEQK